MLDSTGLIGQEKYVGTFSLPELVLIWPCRAHVYPAPTRRTHVNVVSGIIIDSSYSFSSQEYFLVLHQVYRWLSIYLPRNSVLP